MQRIQKRVQNIIFDLGGVLLNIDYTRTVEAFRNLGLSEPEKAFTKEYQAELFQRFETSIITEDVFLSELGSRMPGVSHAQISAAWCAILGDFPDARYKMLKRLSKNYNLLILSNTNIIHQKAFEKTIDTNFGWNNFSRLFEAVCYSHNMGLRKPNLEIFHAVIDKYKLDPSETLFIDDTEEHIFGAKKTNMIVHHLKPHEEITELLKSW